MTHTFDPVPLQKQEEYLDKCRLLLEGREKYVCIETYGCQQNQADSDRLRGMAVAMGYRPTENPAMADLLIFNSCAVREHAEKKILSKIGEAVHLKAHKKDMLVAVCGCMVQQEHRRAELQKSYPHVDIVLGTHTFWLLPEALYGALSKGSTFVKTTEDLGAIPETTAPKRSNPLTAHVTIMYGCNNFCSYCIVPYTRGREKSRSASAILAEVRQAVAEGYKEILLLGQNVNSYTSDGLDFAALLEQIDAIDGDYWLKFMTSHPKDATPRLFAVMAKSRHIPPALHLPVQSGSTRVLGEMNRKYSKEDYLALVAEARAALPHLELSTDWIVGFPGETEADFSETLSLAKEVGFDTAFTFVYSRRKGTKAYDLQGQVSAPVKKERMGRLLALQGAISEHINRASVGTLITVLVCNPSTKRTGLLLGKTPMGRVVTFSGDEALVGTFQQIRITEGKARELRGQLEAP